MAHAFSQVSHALSLCESVYSHPYSSLCWHLPTLGSPLDRGGTARRRSCSECKFLRGWLFAGGNTEKESRDVEYIYLGAPVYFVDFSPEGFRVLVHRETIHAHDVWLGDALSEIDSIPYSMHDHVHVVWGEMREKRECWSCWSSFLKNGEYWFTESDRRLGRGGTCGNALDQHSYRVRH